MIWNAARGGMRSVVEGYVRDGLIEKENFVLIHSYADGGFVYRQAIFVRALFQYLWTMLRNDVELVHCHVAMRGSFVRKSIFALLARAMNVPVVLHLHGSEMKKFYFGQNAFFRRRIIGQLQGAQAVVVLSESWRSFVREIAPAANVIVVRNYVRIPAGARQARSDESVLFLGLIGERKGAYDLLNAFAEVRSTCPSMRLVLAGNGEIDKAQALAAELGIAEFVSFPGWIGDDTRAELLETASIFVLPSYNEGLPMSVLEAMAYGVPVITTPVGGIPELVTNGANGILVEPGDRAALARSIVALRSDPELRRRLASQAYSEVCERYSSEAVLPVLSQVYKAATSVNQNGDLPAHQLRSGVSEQSEQEH
jgi:glycosyltransferase involved in cell wall biosynthesis